MENVEGKRATHDTVCEVIGKTMVPGVRAVKAEDGNENEVSTIMDREDGIEGVLELAVVSAS